MRVRVRVRERDREREREKQEFYVTEREKISLFSARAAAE
jgi:hypothetical protein